MYVFFLARERHRPETAGVAVAAARLFHGTRGRRERRAALHGSAGRRTCTALHARYLQMSYSFCLYKYCILLKKSIGSCRFCVCRCGELTSFAPIEIKRFDEKVSSSSLLYQPKDRLCDRNQVVAPSCWSGGLPTHKCKSKN